MKILILNGSPRLHGNTSKVVRTMDSMLAQEHTVELLDICSMQLSGCVACDACKANGGHCVRPDESDAVIFGTPVYWWGMSAQLKMVVDKFYSQDSQFKTMKKKIGVVVTGANGLDDPQYRLIDEQFRCIAEYLHWDMAFSLAFAAYEPGEVMQQEGILAQLQDACEKIAQ